MAFLRQIRSLHRVRPTVLTIGTLFAAVAVLHITIPSVMSVATFEGVVETFSAASRMPGVVTNIGYDRVTPSDNLYNVMASVPHFLTHLSSAQVPPGWNGT